jgi:hypothetical protein
VTDAATSLAIEGYRQTITEMADLAGDEGFVSSTRRWNRLVDLLREHEAVVRESADGRAAVEAFLDDPRPTVRLWAATAVLSWDEPRGRDVLTEIREKPTPYGINSINAKQTLLALDAGRLDPPAPS